MELVDLGFSDTDDVLRRLRMFGAFWGSHKWFEGLDLHWNTVWKSNIETLAVFLYGNRQMNVVLKLEYVHQSPMCKIEVSSMLTGGLFPGTGELKQSEVYAKKLLVELFSLSQEQLYSFAADHDMLELFPSQGGDTSIFECPHCGAKYSERKLKHNSDGSILCQNCDLWISPRPSSPEEQKAE